MKVTELATGHNILGWMKPGFALRKQRLPNGHLYRDVPSRPDRFDKDDLQSFTGLVISNDTTNHILRLEVSRMNRYTMPVSESLPVEIHYKAFLRIRKLSAHAFAPRAENPLRPTRQGIGTGFYPYRTQEEVQLIWT